MKQTVTSRQVFLFILGFTFVYLTLEVFKSGMMRLAQIDTYVIPFIFSSVFLLIHYLKNKGHKDA